MDGSRINNAGIGSTGHFQYAGPERLRQIMETNFFAVCELTRLAIPLLKNGEDPAILMINSVAGRRAIAFSFGILREQVWSMGFHVHRPPKRCVPNFRRTTFRFTLFSGPCPYIKFRAGKYYPEDCLSFFFRFTLKVDALSLQVRQFILDSVSRAKTNLSDLQRETAPPGQPIGSSLRGSQDGELRQKALRKERARTIHRA